MEDILKTLSELQIKALHKGIGFKLDADFAGDNSISISVDLSYFTDEPISRRYFLTTTIDDSLSNEDKNTRIQSINDFISTISR